ncbi:hypothetical protein ITP53_11290 [Nonomuraea sp. K274]|uniref:HK97 gp10 family phage protein n=1 Tax=Nonomuraea cypriaca TaxID=1187855 RepID=A0A931EYB6_9ACTN|nr:hypothetical protein [Nonomuraea cypriaca]MBF8186322.1 hypothetical protein [Nonomuraea cypriaca]
MPQSFKLKWTGNLANAAARKAAVRGLQKAADELLGRSRQLVPIEEHTLEISGTASVDESRMTGVVSYDTPYAVRQHEDLTYKHDAGRQAKYLEQPLTEGRDELLDIVAAEIRRALA